MENIKSTGKLEISSTILNDDHLLKKLNESTINIHTVEIKSKCKLKEVMKKYSLPPCLKLLSITDNNLDCHDVSALSSGSLNNLYELDLSRTKFKGNSFVRLGTAITNCNIQSLCLTDNGLTEEYRKCLVSAFNSIENIKKLNLSKNNLTEAQANDILQKHEGKTIVSLDLSQNALQGDKLITNISKLQSLEELNLSHNHIRFPQLRSSAEESDNFLTNTKIISCSVRSLSSLRINHLKVLSLANTDICGSAVQDLAIVLSSANELEELNLSSNNLMLEDFRQLISPLSILTKLKKLNLSNNPEGVSVVLEKILPHMKFLEELRLSNTHLNGDDCNNFFKSLGLLNELKYLDLSNNAIGPSAVRTLSDILKKLPLLAGLDLSKCCIQEDDIFYLCVSFKPLNNLKYLNLSENLFKADDILVDSFFFPSTLEEVILSDIIHGEKVFNSMRIPLKDELRKLHLSKMKLRPCDVEALADMLSSFLHLEELVLTDVVADLKCEKVFGAIGNMTKMKKLVFRGGTVDNQKAFFDMLSRLSVLEEIMFPNVVIDGSVTEDFNVLKSLVYLKNLDLSETSIDDVALADVLPSLKLLEKLTLGRIMRTERTGDQKLCSAIGKLNYLKELNLSRYFECLDEALLLLQFLEKLKFYCDDESNEQLFRAVGELKYLKILHLISHSVELLTDLTPLAEALPLLHFLEELNLSIRFDDGGSDEKLFHAFGRLKYLKKLEICETNFTQIGVVALTEILPSLNLLENFVFIEIDFKSESQLFKAIEKLKYLKEIDLSESNLTQLGVAALTEILPSLKLLEKLVLATNSDITYDKELFHAVGKLKYLKVLDLCSIKITQQGVVTLINMLPSLKMLESLTFSEIDLDSESETGLFQALERLKYLTELNLEWVKITPDGALALADVLPTLELLKILRLGENEFNEKSNEQLFLAVKKLKHLQELWLWRTKITNNGAGVLAQVLPCLLSLEQITLRSVKFNEGSEEQLFRGVANCKYLKKLSIYDTKITRKSAVALADALSSLTFLEQLALCSIVFVHGSDTKLFNDELNGKLKYLKKLSLYKTKVSQDSIEFLTGVLPTLYNLREFTLPKVQNNENETGDEMSDENGLSVEINDENGTGDEVNDENGTSDEVSDENETSAEMNDENETSEVNDENETGDEVNDENGTSDEVSDENETSAEMNDENETGDEVNDENGASDEVNDENETGDEGNDENETPLSKLRTAAERIHGLYVNG